MRRAHNNEDGFALVTAIVLLTVMMGLGLGLLFLTDSQQKASSREQAGEIAFNVAEAALNAQTSQLSHAWPGPKGPEYPASCTAANAAASGCPDKGSLEAGYPITSPTACPAGQPADPWGSALTNEWTTYVRDNGPVGAPSTLYSSSVKSLPAYDANGDGKVWVRSVGVVQCRVITVVSLISQQLVTAIFPAAAIAANWFETSNTGNKLIINTQGKAGQPGEVSMRCEGKTAAECESYREGQINPDTTKESKPAPNPAIPVTELEGIKKLAISNNTYFGPGKCPANLSELSGKPVYLEGNCKLEYGNGVANSAEAPGFLVIVSGTLELNSKAEFFGTIYDVNAQKSSGVVVEVHGNAKVTGSIVVDGAGGISFGSTGAGKQENENFTFNGKATEELKTLAGAAATRNSFRVLPINQ